MSKTPNLKPGSRVRGAWGNGTIIAGPFGHKTEHSLYGNGMPITKVYVGVRWDNGFVSNKQLAQALRVIDGFGVIQAHCPNCDEPDMIFYGEDYICAWCREHLEDAMC